MVKPVGCGKLAPHPPPLSPRSAYVVPCVRRRAGTPRAAQYPLRVGHESPQTTEEGDLLLGKGSVLLVGRVILFPRRRRSRERFGGARASDLGVTSTGSPDDARSAARPRRPPAGRVLRPESRARSWQRRAEARRECDAEIGTLLEAAIDQVRKAGRSAGHAGDQVRALGRTIPKDQPTWIDPFDKIRRVNGHPSFAFRALVRGWLKVSRCSPVLDLSQPLGQPRSPSPPAGRPGSA